MLWGPNEISSLRENMLHCYRYIIIYTLHQNDVSLIKNYIALKFKIELVLHANAYKLMKTKT